MDTWICTERCRARAGAILTKMDGDSRGGAALSVKAVSGKPIKFVGTGETLEALEPFYPDRTASRILGASRSSPSLCPSTNDQGHKSVALYGLWPHMRAPDGKAAYSCGVVELVRRQTQPPQKCCSWHIPAGTSLAGAWVRRGGGTDSD